MRIFEEIDNKGNSTGKAVIEVDKKESAAIMEAIDWYCEANKRKKNVKKILDHMEASLPWA